MENENLSNKEAKKQQKEEKKERRELQERKKAIMKWLVTGCILIAIVGVIVGVVMTRESASNIADKTQDPTRGPEDAKVVVRVYEDFQCPACAAVYPALKDIIAEYEDRVKFVFNDFPLPQHKNATIAAVAAQCAYEQGKYTELSDVLYEKQTEWGEKSNSRAQEIILGYAKEIGVDESKFNACVTAPEAAGTVNEDLQEGRRLGVNSTPSFFVNDTRVTETPFSTNIRKAIDEALAQ